MPSDRLRKALQHKLTGTLGAMKAAAPVTQAPAQDAMIQSLNHSLQLARDAMTAMTASARPAQGANEYQMGIMDAMRAHQENLSEPGHRRFSAIQKARLQGYCNAASWNEVLKI